MANFLKVLSGLHSSPFQQTTLKQWWFLEDEKGD